MAMKSAGCTKVAVANDKEAYGSRPGDPDRAGEGLLRRQRRQRHGDRPDRRRTSAPTPQTIQASGRRLLRVRRHRLQRRRADHQGRRTRPSRRRRSSAGDGVCTSSYTSASKGGVPAAIDPQIQCTVATLDLAVLPGRQGVPDRLQGRVRRLGPRPVRDLRLRGRCSSGSTPSSGLGAKGDNKASVLAALFATKVAQLGARHVRVRRQRRHDAEVLRPVQGRLQTAIPVFFETLTPTKTVS